MGTVEQLKNVWETVRLLRDQQNEWYHQRWHKIDTAQLRAAADKQLEIARALPENTYVWDVYHGLLSSIHNIQVSFL